MASAPPWIVVVGDRHHTRTWFASLPEVAEQLQQVDLSPIESAGFVYVDGYELIETAALRVVEATRAAGVPLLLNLGGSPLSDALSAAVGGVSQLLIQTNVDDVNYEAAPAAARVLQELTGAMWAVVTAGARGAVAIGQTERFDVPAYPVDVRHTHCAGAAFSGGLLYGLWAGRPMEECLRLGAASGALRCERAHSDPLPTLVELAGVITDRQRLSVM